MMLAIGIFLLILYVFVVIMDARRSYYYSKSVANGQPEHRVLKFWRDDLAKYYYRLQHLGGYGNYYYDTEEEGNFRWAQRQQKHYNCKIVGEGE